MRCDASFVLAAATAIDIAGTPTPRPSLFKPAQRPRNGNKTRMALVPETRHALVEVAVDSALAETGKVGERSGTQQNVERPLRLRDTFPIGRGSRAFARAVF